MLPKIIPIKPNFLIFLFELHNNNPPTNQPVLIDKIILKYPSSNLKKSNLTINEEANKHNLAMIFTSMRHFKH